MKRQCVIHDSLHFCYDTIVSVKFYESNGVNRLMIETELNGCKFQHHLDDPQFELFNEYSKEMLDRVHEYNSL